MKPKGNLRKYFKESNCSSKDPQNPDKSGINSNQNDFNPYY